MKLTVSGSAKDSRGSYKCSYPICLVHLIIRVGLLIMFLRCLSNCWVSGRKSSYGGWRRVKATHSASEVASFWSLALAEADRFKSPPGGRGRGEKWVVVRRRVCRDVTWQKERLQSSLTFEIIHKVQRHHRHQCNCKEEKQREESNTAAQKCLTWFGV